MVGNSAEIKAGNTRTCRLRAADILLIHAKHNFWSWIVRLGTHCYWNHASLVYSPGDFLHYNGKAMIIDAKTSGAVVIGSADEYFSRPEKYDIAVKRLDEDWFQLNSSSSRPDFCQQVCGIALKEANIKPGRYFTKTFNRIRRQFIVISRFLRRKIRKIYTPPRLPWNIRPRQVRAFTCSGFVQWCYYQAVLRRIEESGAGYHYLDEVIFNPRAVKAPSPYEMLTTTPADLASCEKLAWKYTVKNGIVREVSSAREVAAIMAAV